MRAQQHSHHLRQEDLALFALGVQRFGLLTHRGSRLSDQGKHRLNSVEENRVFVPVRDVQPLEEPLD